MQPRGVPLDYPPDRSPNRTVWIVLSALVVAVVLAIAALAAVLAAHRTVGGTPHKAAGETWMYSPTATPPSQAPTARRPLTLPRLPRLPATNPPHDGTPGPLGGPTFGPGDELFHFDNPLLPFEFDLPHTWGCMHVRDAPLDVKLTCRDDAEGEDAPGGWIGVNRCASPCGVAEQSAVRAKLAVAPQDWRTVDPSTMIARIVGFRDSGDRAVRIAMTCAFASRGGDTPDNLAVVVMSGPPHTEEALQMIANEIRMRIPA